MAGTQSSAYDVAVIGGGIVGMATAVAMLRRAPRSLVVLEAEPELAAHQTGRNSGVIHSGIYYKPGSLKATLCAEGRLAMERLCAERGVPFERCGKVIVATSDAELPALAELERRGRANALTGVTRLGPEQLRDREPNVVGVAALEVTETGIVSYRAVTRALAQLIVELGGEVRMASPVRGVHRGADGFTLDTNAAELRARFLVNCAGLQCDRVARMCGLEPGLRIIPFKGEYYDLKPASRGLVKHLIYPVPDPRFPFLGVHFTRAVDGTVEAGPNAVLSLDRHGYDGHSVRAKDALETLSYAGFWRLARKHWRMGAMEFRRSLSPSAFVAALQKLMPCITLADLERGRAGIRAQAVEPSGALVDDFRLVEGQGMLHVLNAPSPAATASLAIGRHLAEAAHRISSGHSGVARLVEAGVGAHA